MVTDQTGAVVSRHDYLPFGEEIPSTMCNRTSIPGYGSPDGTRQRFSGKERDAESGLDYFGARYFSGAQGRFTSTDPKNAGATPENPQSWNGYAYCLNNPLKFVDQNGKWPTAAHNAILNIAFERLLSQEQMKILQDASYNTDYINKVNDLDPQKPPNAFIHAMRNGASSPPQTVEEAARLANAFILDNTTKAIATQAAFEESGKTGISPEALRYFGNALHTIMDSYSPSHAGYQAWTGNGFFWNKLMVHGSKEIWPTPKELEYMTKALDQYFLMVFKSQIQQKEKEEAEKEKEKQISK